MQWCSQCRAEHADFAATCGLCGSALVDRPIDPAIADEDPAPTDAGPPLASVGRRMVAEAVAGFVWAILLAAAVAVADRLDLPVFAWSLSGFVAVMAAEITLLARTGADPGKFLLRLRVIGADGARPRWGQAALRSLVLWGTYVALGWAARLTWEQSALAGQVLGFAPLGWLVVIVWSMATHPEHQGWHDRLAGTWVIEHRPTRRPPASR